MLRWGTISVTSKIKKENGWNSMTVLSTLSMLPTLKQNALEALSPMTMSMTGKREKTAKVHMFSSIKRPAKI